MYLLFDSKMTQVKIFVLLMLIAVWVDGEKTDDNRHLCLGTTPVERSKLQFLLYNKANKQNGLILGEETYKEVDPNLRVVVIIHGWLQAATKAWVLDMKDAYLNLEDDANIVAIDWSYYSGINYIEAYCSVPAVGDYVGNLIYNLTTTPGIDLTEVQINGFSLGAHIAGYAGQEVQTRTGGKKIGRIIGLDAALEFYWYPLVGPVSTDERLDASDADFVQAIHTCVFEMGYPDSYGHVDFYVNELLIVGCGAQQTGCPLVPGITVDGNNVLPYIMCNHVRSIAYFIESIKIVKYEFIGVKCKSCSQFGLGMCSRNEKTIMGENCPSTARGDRYLNTKSTPPFAKG